jgi:hypothetical protein
MNFLTEPLRQLVRRKLWPVALLLVAALVAVPLTLAKQPVTPPPPVPTANEDGMPATFVAAAEPAETLARKRVLGKQKDPFEPAPLSKAVKKQLKAAKDAKKKSESDAAAKTDSGTGGAAAGGGGKSASPPAGAEPTPTATPTPMIPAYSVNVRFGNTDGETAPSTVERLAPLPDEETPVLVYRGVEDGGKVAVFELTGKVDAQGDGECLPKPEDCQYLKLRAGETEFITVTETGDETDAQYQLDLVKIYKKATKAPAGTTTEAASESLAKASASKLKGLSLRKRNRYVFDKTTGTLHRATGKTPSSTL